MKQVGCVAFVGKIRNLFKIVFVLKGRRRRSKWENGKSIKTDIEKQGVKI
jgi:hypothetical protein